MRGDLIQTIMDRTGTELGNQETYNLMMKHWFCYIYAVGNGWMKLSTAVLQHRACTIIAPFVI